ncbi:13007_t:CDS:2, partial [Racocetra fulgida]
SCAFVEFYSQDIYRQVLQQREIFVPGFGDETVVVEERQERRRDNNSRYRNRQNDDNYQRNYSQALYNTHNGMSSQRRGNEYRIERNPNFTLYVKVGKERIDRDALWSAFSYFGPVKNLDVVPAKSCAFVEFYSQDAYQQALYQRQISVPGFGNQTVVVEERRERRKDDNNRYRNRQRQW